VKDSKDCRDYKDTDMKALFVLVVLAVPWVLLFSP